MNSPELPDNISSAVRAGDVARLDRVFTPGDVSVQDIAQEAAIYRQPAILEWCYAQGWQPSLDTTKDPFYNSASFSASPEIFQVMLNHGWDINHHQSVTCGDTLASAIMNGYYGFAKWLLEHGHTSTPLDPLHGPTSISVTIHGDDADTSMLKALIEHGHDLRETGAGIAAADAGNLKALEILLDAGVDLEDRQMSLWYSFDEDKDEPYESQGTALYRACRQGHLDCAVLLLKRGADPCARDDGGISCLEIAERRGHRDVFNLLRENGVTE